MPRRHVRTAVLLAALAAATIVVASPAVAAVPSKAIVSGGPLTNVTIGNELGCQVAHTGDAKLELFPSAVAPGDCGTFVALAGTLYTPNFAAHDGSATSSLGSYTPLTPVSQSSVSGSGTAGSPFKVTTAAAAGATGLRVTQVDSYVVGQESYRTDSTLSNSSGGPLAGILYRAGDCYLQSSDTGFGFVDGAAGAVGCSINANNAPPARIEQWYPITRGNQYMEASFSEVWARIATQTPLPNTTRAAEAIDNGAGISWSFAVPAGGSQTFSHYTTFSPRGISGPPQALPPVPGAVFGPNGAFQTPSNRRCVSKRYFRIRLRKKYWPIFVGATIKMPKTTRVLTKRPWGTIVDLRGLPRGRFVVKIAALTTTGKTLKGKRAYRTCRGRLKGGRPPL
jgi:hypothetical protein